MFYIIEGALNNTDATFDLDSAISYSHFREDREFPPPFSLRGWNAANY